ncbi:major facilitator superfamily domain-containing protein [Xylaria grammica]|nr:major facilitator superfamily domain-containing protein [Xylaria grammica]
MEGGLPGLGNQLSEADKADHSITVPRPSASGERSSDETPCVCKFVPPPEPIASSSAADAVVEAEKEPVVEQDNIRELKEEDCEDELGYAFSTWKKWWILTVIFLVQTSMNFNTSLYSNGIQGIAKDFHKSDQDARLGAALFLITYAIGCELWAPWSEEFGRKLILQLSLSLTNIWAIPVGLAPNFTTVLVARSLGGLSTAGGSVTLGMIADMYDRDNQQYAIAYVVFSSVGGSILGPIIGGFVEILPPSQAWRWCTWIQLIFGVSVQLLHLFTVPETRTTIMMDRIAKRRREAGEDMNIYGPGEMHPFRQRFTFRELIITWSRAFEMLFTEPIVSMLSVLSGLADGIVFMQIQSLSLAYEKWGFNPWQTGLAFVPFLIGYFVAWMAFIPTFKLGKLRREQNPLDDHLRFESRLSPLLWSAPLLPIGLVVFGWTSKGPPLHWVGTMFGSALVGIANYAIYMATIDYMICAYGPFSASATGGNGLARDLLAGVLTPAAIPFYNSLGTVWGSTVLAVASSLLVVFVYYVYGKGPKFRNKSKFAQDIVPAEGGLGSEGGGEPPHVSSAVAVEAALAAQSAQPREAPFQRSKHTRSQQTPFQSTPPVQPTGFGAASVPINIPAAPSHSQEVQSAVPERPSFGPASPRGSYMASVHAASRRQIRQDGRSPTSHPDPRNS